MNTLAKTFSVNYDQQLYNNQLSIGQAFCPSINNINNSQIQNRAPYHEQMSHIQLRGASTEDQRGSFKQRRLSGDANPHTPENKFDSQYSLKLNDFANNSYHGFTNGFTQEKNQKNDWFLKTQSDQSTEFESSTASSAGGDNDSQQTDEPHSFLFQKKTKSSYCEATRGAQKRIFKNADERQVFKQQYESKKKTELCRNFEMYGQCKFGDTCSYAHGKHQLQRKTHLPSNFMTKMCTQFHEEGVCMYGERCQFLHSIYDLKSELTYTQSLKEGGRLTQQRNNQISKDSGAECLWANLKTGNGCGAPKGPRLQCFEQAYNKENQENLQILQEEDELEKDTQMFNNYPQYNMRNVQSFNGMTKSSSYNVKYNYQPQMYQTPRPNQYQKSTMGYQNINSFMPAPMANTSYSPQYQGCNNNMNRQSFFRQI